MIKMQVIGHLGKDAVVNTLDSGKTVINFTVAHSEKFKDAQGNQKEKTIWVECAYWTDRTGIAPYLKKGGQVYVEGSPDTKTYAKQDGTMGVTVLLRVIQVQLLGSANGSNGVEQGSAPAKSNPQPQAQHAAQRGSASPANDITEPIDDLPF